MKGSIRRKGKHSYQVRVYLGHDSATNRDRWALRSAKTKQQADQILAQILGQVQSGGYVPPSKQTVGAYLDTWMDTYVRGGRRAASTVYGYDNIVHQVQASPLGAMPISAVGGQVLDAYYTAKLAEGLSGNSVRGHHRVLSSAFGKAVKKRQLVQNPCLFATPPDATTRETASPDEEQVHLLLGRAKRESAHYSLYYTAAMTGLRQSELAGLRWNVSLKDAVIQVKEAFLRVGKDEVWKGPKSKKARPPLAIPETVVAMLREVKADQERAKEILEPCAEGTECRRRACPFYHDFGLVFCQGNGKPLHMRNVYWRDYVPLLERTGLRAPKTKTGAATTTAGAAKKAASRRREATPPVTFHSLRHSNISTSARAGIDLSVT